MVQTKHPGHDFVKVLWPIYWYKVCLPYVRLSPSLVLLLLALLVQDRTEVNHQATCDGKSTLADHFWSDATDKQTPMYLLRARKKTLVYLIYPMYYSLQTTHHRRSIQMPPSVLPRLRYVCRLRGTGTSRRSSEAAYASFVSRVDQTTAANRVVRCATAGVERSEGTGIGACCGCSSQSRSDVCCTYCYCCSTAAANETAVTAANSTTSANEDSETPTTPRAWGKINSAAAAAVSFSKTTTPCTCTPVETYFDAAAAAFSCAGGDGPGAATAAVCKEWCVIIYSASRFDATFLAHLTAFSSISRRICGFYSYTQHGADLQAVLVVITFILCLSVRIDVMVTSLSSSRWTDDRGNDSYGASLGCHDT